MAFREIVKVENNYGWEPLLDEATYTCGCCSFGYSRQADDPERCGRKAVWERKRTCNCGKRDMTWHLCSECLVVHLMDECASRDAAFEKAITKVREYDIEIPSRKAARQGILGWESFPPDKPDEYYVAKHASGASGQGVKS